MNFIHPATHGNLPARNQNHLTSRWPSSLFRVSTLFFKSIRSAKLKALFLKTKTFFNFFFNPLSLTPPPEIGMQRSTKKIQSPNKTQKKFKELHPPLNPDSRRPVVWDCKTTTSPHTFQIPQPKYFYPNHINTSVSVKPQKKFYHQHNKLTK